MNTTQPGADTAAPIYLTGILKRSGTNFLEDLLMNHPDLERGDVIREDYLLDYSHHLRHFVEAVYRKWNPGWEVDKRYPPAQLYAALGEGLWKFLKQQQQTSKRFITKTPSVRNLLSFFDLFPGSPTVIVVRDGRAVVDSGMKSFNWTFEGACQEWAKGARIILEFDRRHRDSGKPYLLSKYEDIFSNTEAELTRILTFLGLDVSRFNMATALNQPIRGSSAVVTEQKEQLHWKPQERPKNFNPLDRWKNWDAGRHERFNWVCGKEMQALGYELVTTPGGPKSSVMNLLRDVGRTARGVVRKARGKPAPVDALPVTVE